MFAFLFVLAAKYVFQSQNRDLESEGGNGRCVIWRWDLLFERFDTKIVFLESNVRYTWGAKSSI